VTQSWHFTDTGPRTCLYHSRWTTFTNCKKSWRRFPRLDGHHRWGKDPVQSMHVSRRCRNTHLTPRVRPVLFPVGDPCHCSMHRGLFVSGQGRREDVRKGVTHLLWSMWITSMFLHRHERPYTMCLHVGVLGTTHSCTSRRVDALSYTLSLGTHTPARWLALTMACHGCAHADPLPCRGGTKRRKTHK